MLILPGHCRPFTLSQPTPSARPYETHDNYTFAATARLQRRQQQPRGYRVQQQSSAFSSSSGGSVAPSLRRTPHFDERQLPRSRSASVDSANHPSPNVRSTQDRAENRPQRSASVSGQDRPDLHRAVRISSRTASAILYTLEVGLRTPNPFTPDIIEEQASMADLVGSSNGTARRNNGGSRPAVGTVASPGGVRTPRDIMRERNAREEAKRTRKTKDEAEAENLRRLQDEERLVAAERRMASAGVTAPMRDSGYRSAGPSAGGITPAEPVYTIPSIPGGNAPARERGSGGYIPRQQVQSPYESSEMPSQYQQGTGGTARPRASQPSQSQPNTRTQQQPQQQPQPQPQVSTTRPPQTTSQTRPTAATGPTSTGRGPSTQPVIGSSGNEGPQRNSNVSSFPHAFERWETLSSRWEGLTSYWIRKLENNPAKADINQEMARQITDLAAAGANLFHAVVELQRLRASSERKFQRWFFETRAQQEQAQEDQARLHQMLEQEQAAREADRQTRVEDTRGAQRSRDIERLLQESRRELQISKDEARRAWEELGRREQAERDRISSLKEGHPIELGGIQVVPHNGPSRGGSLQRPPGQGATYQMQPQGQSQVGHMGTTQGGQDYGYDGQQPSPTDTDPFSSGARAPPSISPPPVGSTYPQYPQRTTSAQGATPPPERGNIPPPAPAVPMQQPTRADMPMGATAQPTESPSARFYTHEGSYIGEQAPGARQAAGRAPMAAERGREGSDTEEEPDYELDDRGHVKLDVSGEPVPYRGGPARVSRAVPYTARGSASSDELDVAADIERERISAEQYGRATSQGNTGSMTRPGVVKPPFEQAGVAREYGQGEYEGEGFPEDDLEWQEQETQRHHHPTRLSDVPEEDERSRGSMSRPSRGSGGMF